MVTRLRVHVLLVLVLQLAAGCAARGRARAPAARVEARPTTQRVAPTTLPSIATLPLGQILPAAELPTPRPTTAPATAPTTSPADADRPPIDALVLYAEAVDHLNANRRTAAAELLEKAAALDPNSFEVLYSLGRARARDAGTPDPRAIEAYERAAAIDPDHLRLQTELGRLYLAAGEEGKALWHLRLALKTSDYAEGEADAAAAELLLGRALSREGYHAAAVEVYERLAARLQNPSPALRADPETAFLIARPELLKLQLAESYAQAGRFEPALEVYRDAARRDPGSFELRARVVRALLGLNRREEAAAEAAEAVARFRASPASVALLRETTSPGGVGGLVEQLQQLRRQRPRERSLLFALADVMKEQGRADEARRVLTAAAVDAPADPEVVRRLYESARDSDPTGRGAALMLVDWSARFPQAVHLLGDHWDDLLRHVGGRRFGLRDLLALEAPGDAPARWAAAKDFWAAHVARLRHRRDVARQILTRAAESRPLFAPAPRAWAGWDLAELGVTKEQRIARVGGLAEAASAEQGDGPALAEELRGMLLLSARDFAGARERLARAVGLSDNAPERRFTLAVSARGAGDDAAFEQAMWKLISDWPGFEDAYDALYALYDGRGNEGAAQRVLSAWLAADPGSVPARLVQVRDQVRAGRVTAAQGLIQRLLADRPGDPRVLAMLRAMYGQAGSRTRLWLVTQLQQLHASSPGDLGPAAQLVDLLATDGRPAEAIRALDATRGAVADDPDLLYQVAHLYERVGQKATTEQVLAEALKLEPGHAPAANDLAYTLAEEGRDLGRAESLARLAVAAEPQNASFLDSLGWVLYKRGKLAEARERLERSAAEGGDLADDDAGGAGPDPVVLDHLGDTIYRLGDAKAAGAQWDLAATRLAAMPPDERDRDDLKQLRLQLERKRKQLEAGQPVSAAPLVEKPPTAPTTSRN